MEKFEWTFRSTPHGLPLDARPHDYANWFMNMRESGEEPTRAEQQLYFDAVNRSRQAHYKQFGNYGDGRGQGIATIDGFIDF